MLRSTAALSGGPARRRRKNERKTRANERLGRIFTSNRNDPCAGVQTTQKRPPSLQVVSRCSLPNLLAVSLPSPAFITLRAQPKLACGRLSDTVV